MLSALTASGRNIMNMCGLLLETGKTRFYKRVDDSSAIL